jgi:hypothetical protein
LSSIALLARRTDDLPVFSIPRLLANEHFGVGGALSKHGLGRIFPQGTGLTRPRLTTQTLDLVARRKFEQTYGHGLTKYSTRMQAIMANATLPMST